MDYRFSGTKRVVGALNVLSGIALERGLNHLSNLYNKYTSPMLPVRTRKRGPRRMFRRVKRRSRRRAAGRARGASRKLIAGKGVFQRRFRKVIGRRLDTRMTRNEYDSTRELVRSGSIVPNVLATGVDTANFQVGDMPLALAKLMDYDEYKVTKIQMVLTPYSFSNGAQTLEVDVAGEPYLYIAPRVHSDNITVSPSLATIKTTPGVMRFHYLRKQPIVINLAPFYQATETTTTSVTGTALDIEMPLRSLNWVHNPQDTGDTYDSTKHPNYGNVLFYFPKLAAGSFVPKWRIEYYATCVLRGNRSLVDI